MNTEDAIYFSSSLVLGRYQIVPRFELITNSIENKKVSYELLCAVLYDEIKVLPDDFLSVVSSSDIYAVYSNALQYASKIGLKHCFLNADVHLVRSGVIERLAIDFKGIKLGIELNENTKTAELTSISSTLKYYQDELGINVHLDDFGLSSFNFDLVNNFSFDGIKVSKETISLFFQHDVKILKQIISYLKLKTKIVIVEGVNDLEKYLFCKKEDLYMQGYYIEFLRKYYEYK